MRLRNRQTGGFVLLVVLALLVVLTVVASIAYSRASDQVVMSSALKRQAIAQDRAVMGLQRGVADVQGSPKPAYLVPLAGSPACTNTDPSTCMPVATLNVPGVSGADLDKGGGSQYMVEYFRWAPPGALNALVMVRSTGFHGFDPTLVPGATRMSSQVVVEVTEGEANKGGCVGYCGSGL